MSISEVKRLENDLRSSEELQKKLEETFKRIGEEGQAGNDGEIMVAAAKELGYDISIASLEQAKADAEQVDPEALEAVAGGVDYRNRFKCEEGANFLCHLNYRDEVEDEYGHKSWCWTVWHCLAASMHTECEDKDVTCWSDFFCVLINKRK